MEVKLAKTAGFCFGVERAVNAVNSELINNKDSKGPICTYGPIVHNDTVVSELENKGVVVINDKSELLQLLKTDKLNNATVVIRAHGVGNDITLALSESNKNIKVIDATCPFVKNIQDTVKAHYGNGEKIIITGSPDHPEVVGILGQINNDAYVIEDIKDAQNIEKIINLGEKCENKYCIVSQSTFNVQKFEDIVDILQKKLYIVSVVMTICNATKLRQKEALALSRECDAMIVIGGRHSSNTTKLYDICRKECRATLFIESLDELRSETIGNSVRCVGITAGASTPKTIIEEVLNYVRDEF